MAALVRTAANAGLFLVSCLLAIGLIEGASCAYSAFKPNDDPDHTQLRLSHPRPYAQSPYYSAALIGELGRVNSTFYTPAGTRLILVRDFAGQFIHHNGGLRVTTDRPANPRRRILLFGGSTIYNGEVPDPFTVASYLQRLANDRQDSQYEVLNFGVTSVNAEQQLDYLKTVALRQDDIVVFFDGGNDVYQGVYRNNPRGTIIGDNAEVFRKLNWAKQLILQSQKSALFSRSCTIREFLLPYSARAVPAHLADPSDLSRIATSAAAQYAETIARAHALLKERGVRFVHFVQPTLFSAPIRTEYETRLIANRKITPAGIQDAMTAGQIALRAVNPKLIARGVDSQDLSELFTQLPRSEDIFLDWMHVTELGNRMIASAIFGRLFPGALDQEATLPGSLSRYRLEDRTIWAAATKH